MGLGLPSMTVPQEHDVMNRDGWLPKELRTQRQQTDHEDQINCLEFLLCEPLKVCNTMLALGVMSVQWLGVSINLCHGVLRHLVKHYSGCVYEGAPK